ncbi:maleylpyruvate isomerase family mycothiol-dependent enzyme [Streptomyces sp. NPDC003077]|uniref:maleylpyruvate isomerase family mycothiol-dependent enzyme n=1 Tax=Streptomyces sp. NPDC003077 TaxID=3154443 RepID=UPI0033A0FB26
MDSQLHQDPCHSWLGAPIDARPLFAPEHAALMATLRDLAPADWGNEAVPGWTVRDLAAHLLGDFYGRLSRDRDDHRAGPAFSPGETLEAFIHRVNREWVDAFSRVSPAALADTLDLMGGQVTRFFERVDLHTPSLGVSWAGVDPAPMWLDSAREFTEFWTHRQQIRHAVGQDTDHDSRPLSVVLDTFMRALPHTLHEVEAPVGTQIQVRVDGPADGIWAATVTGAAGATGSVATTTDAESAGATTDAESAGATTATGPSGVATDARPPGSRWSLAEPALARPAALVRLDAETAWRLCTRGIQPDTALARAHIDGDRSLAEAACRIVSIVY